MPNNTEKLHELQISQAKLDAINTLLDVAPVTYFQNINKEMFFMAITNSNADDGPTRQNFVTLFTQLEQLFNDLKAIG